MDPTGGNARLIVYGHNFCGLVQQLAQALADGEPRFKDELRQLARGYLSVPTVVFPDGTVVVEPWPADVLSKLSLHQPGLIERLFRQ